MAYKFNPFTGTLDYYEAAIVKTVSAPIVLSANNISLQNNANSPANVTAIQTAPVNINDTTILTSNAAFTLAAIMGTL